MAHKIAGVPPNSGAAVIALIEALIVPLVPTGIWCVLIAGNSIAEYLQTSIWVCSVSQAAHFAIAMENAKCIAE